MKLHPTVQAVTARIRSRSETRRRDYLEALDAAANAAPGAERLGCANVAHAFAGIPASDRMLALPALSKIRIAAERAPNVGIVSAYNDMLSAHAPYQHYPDLIKEEARRQRAMAQVAGCVPAMCDGVTQGTPGMELSLFSRDVIAMATAVALSHDVFDAALLLGVCDKIVPGLLIGALQFGHLPMVFVPAGPMTSGLANDAKARVRELAAQGRVGREELLEAETQAYHGAGTCTFYGTANSNQMLLEAMGLHVPGTAFVNAEEGLRAELTREATRTVLSITRHSGHFTPIGRVVDERAIVNAMVALLATGGSTNHLIHWVAVARAAGLSIDWDDFSALSDVVPLLARVYPNGSADVNQFQSAGGPGYVLRELLDAGLMHDDVLTVRRGGIREFTGVPSIDDGALVWTRIGASRDASVVRPAAEPFSPTGGLKLLQGNLGRSVIKVSAVPAERHVIEAPARVFDSQEGLQEAFRAGELDRDVVCVVRWQGPSANGMPELHKLTSPLAVLQGRGHRVALVTDGRMSGASGKVPAAIHVSPEAHAGGPLARVRDGDLIRLDAVEGTLSVQVSDDDWQARSPAVMKADQLAANGRGTGRGLFAGMRRNVLSAEEGACAWL